VSTTGAAEVTFVAKPKKLADAPKRVWRRETLHTLEGRVSPCPNTVRQGGLSERPVRIYTPLEAREMRVHVTAVTVGRHRSDSSWRTAPVVASAAVGNAVRISPKEACVGTMDGACTWREGERVNEASSRSPNDLELVSRAQRLKKALDAETIRWNALEVLLGKRLTRANVVRPSVSGK
jgi:hypothetical protein